MTGKTESIEVDRATASALKMRAAERGVSVSQLVAELVPLAIDDEAIAEFGPALGGNRSGPRDGAACRRRALAAHLGHAEISILV
jgi:hypothetical protein